ncbi:hypothetical protein AVEN_29327-1 [Araneus ventricosus]|uniref:Uncharacterized protein n=1 Tax=Araneus ventricosus TaxID=182803 RepID=A0A4Y2IZ50_ARAVE|nr:hypothetical protein AVEN_29327-1 [Araneus ventricosus]
MIWEGSIDKEKNFRFGLIEFLDNGNLLKGMMVAKTFVDLSKGTIPVRVANLSDKPNVIKKGEVLAKCAPVTCIERLDIKPVFRISDDVGRMKLTQHRIDTGNHRPMRQNATRLPFAKVEEVKDILRDMQEKDVNPHLVLGPLPSFWSGIKMVPQGFV